MQLRAGYELIYECPQPTPMILTLHIHSSRVYDIVTPDHLVARPSVGVTACRDVFGNWCSRIIAPTGEIMLSADAPIDDTGRPDVVDAVADRAWFVYANGIRDGAPFDDVLRFRTRVLPYDGNDAWVEPALGGAADCLASGSAPEAAPGCAFCAYVARASAIG